MAWYHMKDIGAHISFHKLCKIDVPNLERYGEGEELCAALIHLEAFLVVLVLFQESRIVDDDLCVRDSKVQDLVIDCLRRFHGTQGLFKIDVERPQLERLKQPYLCR